MILGIYHPARGVGHDTGVAVINRDGRPIAAQSEERFSRVKMDGGFPFKALESLQRLAGFGPKDLACVAVPYLGPAAQVTEGLRLLLASTTDPAVAWRQLDGRLRGDHFQRGMAAIGAYRYLDDYKVRLQDVRDRDGRPPVRDWHDFLRQTGFGDVPLVRVDHHLAHAAGAYFASARDECLVITCDGVGALKSGIVAVGRAGRLRTIARTFYPHSPGEFWEVLTAICGFHHMKHGGKVTGLAAHGDRDAACYRVMRDALAVDGLTVRTRLDPVKLARLLDGVSRERHRGRHQRAHDRRTITRPSHFGRACIVAAHVPRLHPRRSPSIPRRGSGRSAGGTARGGSAGGDGAGPGSARRGGGT